MGDLDTLQEYLTSPSKAQNVYSDIQSTIGNPVYLYLNGLVSGEQLYGDIQNLLYEPIDISGADWKTLRDDAYAAGDDLLTEAYDLIEAGLSPDRVRAALSNKFADSLGMLDDNERNQLDFLKESLATYSEAWNNAKDIEEKISIGVYRPDPSGRILAPVDWQTGFSRLRSWGLDEYNANPDLWWNMPDPVTMGQADTLAKEAGLLNQDFEKLASATTKKSAKTAENVYKEFITKYGGAARADKGEGFGSTRGGTPAPTPVKPGKETAKQGGFAASRGVPAAKPAARPQTSTGFPASRGVGSAPAPQTTQLGKQADYWAKLAASYAGRAAQEANAKQLATMKSDVEKKEAEAAAVRSAALSTPNTRGLQMLQMASLMAAQGGGGGGRPAPRVLSDQEIQSMASMIAGSMQQ